MSQTEAQKAAKARYNAKNGQISVRVSKAESDALNNFIELHKDEITKTRFIVRALNYFIERGEIPPESEILPTDDSSEE